MSRKNHRSVLIAGAGPAGLAAGLFLHERGVDVEIVDPGELPADDELAVVLHRDVVERLADAGITFYPGVDARLVESIGIYDRDRWHADGDLTAVPPSRGGPLVVPRWLLCKKLDALLRARGVEVGWNHRLARVDLEGERVIAEVDTLELDGAGYAYAVTEKIVARSARREPAFLIAADGDSSVVRQQLGIHARATAMPEVAASFELVLEHDAGHEARIILSDAATTAIWPLAEHGLRLTFHLPANALHGRRTVGRDDLIALLREHAPELRFRIGELARARLDFRVPAIAERANAGPVWLLGDAARALPLAASGSLNQGVRDAHALAAAITQTLRHGSTEPLAHYASSARRAVATGMDVGATYAAGRVNRYIGEHAHRVLPHVPARGPDLDEVATKLGLVIAR
jgi:2-polyprenyl-6-methoxyphenol hydroxylase-like FAD-dependent oxidoreductase